MISEAALINITLNQLRIMTLSGLFHLIWCSRLNWGQLGKKLHIFDQRLPRVSLWILRECSNITIIVCHLEAHRSVWVFEIKYLQGVHCFELGNSNKRKFNSSMSLGWLNSLSSRALKMQRFHFSRLMDKLINLILWLI